MEDINDSEANREKLIKIRESLNNYFVFCVKKAEFEKEMTRVSSLDSKANTLKRRSEELQQEANKLDETIELHKTKKRKLEQF